MTSTDTPKTTDENAHNTPKSLTKQIGGMFEWYVPNQPTPKITGESAHKTTKKTNWRNGFSMLVQNHLKRQMVLD